MLQSVLLRHIPPKIPTSLSIIELFYNYINDIYNVTFEFCVYKIQTNAYFTYSLSLKITLRCAAI